MNRVFLICTALAALGSCKMSEESTPSSIFTIRHEGMCFVIHNNGAGSSMVQVDCADVRPESDSR